MYPRPTPRNAAQSLKQKFNPRLLSICTAEGVSQPDLPAKVSSGQGLLDFGLLSRRETFREIHFHLDDKVTSFRRLLADRHT